MAGETRVVSVVGKKNCGKTTLVVALAREFSRKGLHVATIKHGTHPATLDAEGTDTWRHVNEGNASKVMLVAPEERVTFEKRVDDANPIALVQEHFQDADIVLVEGFTTSPIPKLEVFRSEIHDAPRWSPDHPRSDKWLAMLVDDVERDYPFPIFRFNDTAWLVALRTLAWDNALVITG